MNWRNYTALAVLSVSLTQMAGDITGWQLLKGIGAASVIAPSPKVFCELNGLEPFACSFAITTDQRDTAVLITPEVYSHLKGPYNRRNVYGAAIAGAPLLPEPMRERVLSYAFAADGPLGHPLGLGDSQVTLAITSNTRGREDTWSFLCRR